jgi:hypothetical protein
MVGLVGMVPASLARFTDTDSATATFSTAQLQPPTGLAVAGGPTVTLTWTPSTSGWATGYEVFRSATSGSGYASIGTVTPATAMSTTDSPGAGTWYYVLRSRYHDWSSVRSNEATVVVGGVPTNTGLKGCANNQADTGGDNNGYQTNPGNACAQDGVFASDGNSGTTTSTLCSNTGKDRHRFWGYALGMPASVASVNGITVQARAGTSSATGTYGICIELSWDGGSTWTAARRVLFSTSAQTNYTFGGAADTWGRSWTAANLGTGSFRVRITDVSSNTSRRFDLDYLGVSVNYTP